MIDQEDHSAAPIRPRCHARVIPWLLAIVVQATLVSSALGVEYHRFISWSQPGLEQEAASALFLFSDATHRCTRLLIDPPDDAPRIVLTLVIDPLEGTYETTLLDDESGWRLTVTEHFPVQATDVSTLNEQLQEAIDEGERSLLVRVAWSGGPPVEATVPLFRQPEPEYAKIAEALASSEKGEDLLTAMPAGLRATIDFVDSVTTLEAAVGYTVRSVIDLVQHLEGETPGLARDWVERASGPRRGLVPAGTEAADLVSRFERIPVDRPLPAVCHRTASP